MPVFGVTRFERFFRAAAELDVDKSDLKRYSDFVERKLYDLLLIGQIAAGANGRDVVEPWDLPVTRGLQESMHAFRDLDDELELEPILGRLATYPALDRALSEQTEARLPAVVGALSVALATTLRLIDPDVRKPRPEHWERVFRVFDQLIGGTASVYRGVPAPSPEQVNRGSPANGQRRLGLLLSNQDQTTAPPQMTTWRTTPWHGQWELTSAPPIR